MYQPQKTRYKTLGTCILVATQMLSFLGGLGSVKGKKLELIQGLSKGCILSEKEVFKKNPLALGSVKEFCLSRS